MLCGPRHLRATRQEWRNCIQLQAELEAEEQRFFQDYKYKMKRLSMLIIYQRQKEKRGIKNNVSG